MRKSDALSLPKALKAAITAARKAGAVMRANLHLPKKANAVSRHDIKLELDVRCQEMIETHLRGSFPQVAVIGEEGITGDPGAKYRWVIDPIDGTVNFTYGIPHASVSIALQEHAPGAGAYDDGYATILGVVYDPFVEEMWTAAKGGPARLNGKVIRVSSHTSLRECIVSIGFAKTSTNIAIMMPYMMRLVHRVRKLRIMGSAALDLAYVAMGRYDAYVERGLRLWDVAAGGFIVERAGGEFFREPARGEYAYRVICSNGRLRKTLRVPPM